MQFPWCGTCRNDIEVNLCFLAKDKLAAAPCVSLTEVWHLDTKRLSGLLPRTAPVGFSERVCFAAAPRIFSGLSSAYAITLRILSTIDQFLQSCAQVQE